MAAATRIELARESEALDLERFVERLGLHAARAGRIVEISDGADAIGAAVMTWLAELREPLVPTRLPDGGLALRPPAA
jgi:hypothetical protein